jgi:hypothetical protein
MQKGQSGQVFALTAVPKTDAGRPAKYQEGTAVFSSSNEAACTIQGGKTLDENGNVIDGTELQAVGTHGEDGEFLITLNADGDPSEGVNEITGLLAGATAPGDATVFEMSATPSREPGASAA